MSGSHPQSHVLDQATGGGGGGGGAPINFRLNGDVSLVVPSAPNTYAGSGIFDAQIPLVDGQTYDRVTLWQRLDGVLGSTTTVELYHYTSGVWSEVPLNAALSIAAGGGDNISEGRSFTAPIVGLPLDRFGVLFTAVQTSDATNTPTDVVVTVDEDP